MFCVIFEVQPHSRDAYFAHAQSLRPLLQQIEGWVDNIRYRSLTRDGTMLSLSSWESEKALVRWRTTEKHYHMQDKGRQQVLKDYHLRVGQVLQDSTRGKVEPTEERIDVTEVGKGKVIVMVEAELGEEWMKEHRQDPEMVADKLGLKKPSSAGHAIQDWDVFEAVLEPGTALLLASVEDDEAAEAFVGQLEAVQGSRTRTVRVIRDYGMFDRRESPQWHSEVPKDNSGGRVTIHS